MVSSNTTRAFNDCLNDFGSVDPKRLVVSYQIPIHDIDFAVAEVRRVAAAGGKSLQLPVFPGELGFPEYFDERYDPLFAAIPLVACVGGLMLAPIMLTSDVNGNFSVTFMFWWAAGYALTARSTPALRTVDASPRTNLTAATG